jgi:hypothetical protein
VGVKNGFIDKVHLVEEIAFNHRERILAAMHRHSLARIPTDIWAAAEV